MDDLTASLLPAQARKCLFGRPDSQEMDSYLNSELTKIEKRHKETWNFDFDNEQPLQGDWEWEKVSPETTRQVVTTECSETIGSAGTASSGCIDANALPRIEQCATGPLQSVQVDNKPTEPERDETGRASVRSDVVQTAEKVVTSSPSKCLPTGEESLELRRSPRRNPPSSTITGRSVLCMDSFALVGPIAVETIVCCLQVHVW